MLRTLALAALLAAAGCRTPVSKLAVADGVFAVPGSDPDHHRLRFVDGQVSANDSCMIRLGNRLNPGVPPVYVNGEPVGFC